MSIAVILFLVAGILAVLDVVLTRSGRTWYLTPVAVILIVIGLLVGGGAISA